MFDVGIENVRYAAKIFFRLIEKGEINIHDDRKLFEIMDEAEVSQVLQVLEEETGTIILKGSDRMYISPKTDNKVFGYTNEELRTLLKVGDNSELYTCYFIMLSILALFYRGEGYDIKCREFVEIEEIHEFIDQKIKGLGEMEDLRAIEDATQINFGVVVSKWGSMIAYDERKENLQASKNNRMAFIKKTCSFLADQGLLIDENSRIVRTTEKMDRMVMGYYTARDRKSQILDFINGIKYENSASPV